ncbi:ly6/PLAUR domain-containing protein 1 [Poeciliopsis prolifica]|uniref:ly6/PLAUR domain-containing protein 1 n=1 Tax=Poeciliopsis prolifica TaxID=188132 RepID=UPI0024135C8D|nr:ly6/PLAUR domain-containing protein 1 [Poeciliopsis prolifica]
MKTVLTLLCLFSLACHSQALKCYSCSSTSEEECNKEGSISCPAYSEVCATITSPNVVIKSCSYKDFCKKAHSNNSGAKIECCFTDDCNGPRHSQQVNTAGALSTSPLVLITPLLLLLHKAFCQF